MTTTKETNDWRATLPEEWTVRLTGEDGEEREIPLREHPALARYESKDEAVKALVHAQKLLGRTPEGYIRLPGPDASEEQVAAFHAALGRPESPDGYTLPELDLPEELELREELLSGLRAKAHELGLTATQAAGLYAWFLPLVLDAHHCLRDEAQRLRDSELESLRAVHRGETPRLLDNALRAAEAIGGGDLLDALTRTGAGDRAAVISAFAKIAPLVLESGLRGAPSGWGEELSRDTLREMMQDPRYHDPSRRDDTYVAKVRKGFEALYPGNYIPGGQI
ncbi:hypothetical protein [Pseudodesulfovibrio pelocollis]|uniref:hypothetical protein n=1 Tax=Pseudodesulfovibrio pelocollis TaxID=3051432 RepID=UPI00255B0D1B|nr:hypothetical protein [Pseudodesulfovibrio sp. SB368]